MTAVRVLFWPVLMLLSVTLGLMLAFVASGNWDTLALLMASWPLAIVPVRLIQNRSFR